MWWLYVLQPAMSFWFLYCSAQPLLLWGEVTSFHKVCHSFFARDQQLAQWLPGRCWVRAMGLFVIPRGLPSFTMLFSGQVCPQYRPSQLNSSVFQTLVHPKTIPAAGSRGVVYILLSSQPHLLLSPSMTPSSRLAVGMQQQQPP